MTDEATTPTRDAWREALRRFAEGDPRARIDVPAQDPDIETLRTIVNEALDLAEVRYGILHDSVMEIAVGMSDVYDTLHAFRHGDMSRRVGTETVALTLPAGALARMLLMIRLPVTRILLNS